MSNKLLLLRNNQNYIQLMIIIVDKWIDNQNTWKKITLTGNAIGEAAVTNYVFSVRTRIIRRGTWPDANLPQKIEHKGEVLSNLILRWQISNITKNSNVSNFITFGLCVRRADHIRSDRRAVSF